MIIGRHRSRGWLLAGAAVAATCDHDGAFAVVDRDRRQLALSNAVIGTTFAAAGFQHARGT